jgi:hypothetical protein
MQDGTHDNVEAKSARLITSPKKGTPGVEIVFQVESGETITGTIWLSEGAFQRSVESLRHTGFRGDDLSELSTVGTRLCQIVVETEQNGRFYNQNVKWVNANGDSAGSGGVAFSPMDTSAAKRFAAQMRGQVIAASGGRAAAAPAARPAAPRPTASRAPASAPPPGFDDGPPPEAPPDFGPGDDDIPF